MEETAVCESLLVSLKVGDELEPVHTDDEAIYECGGVYVLVNHVDAVPPVYARSLRALVRRLLREKAEHVERRIPEVAERLRELEERARSASGLGRAARALEVALRDARSELEYLRLLRDAIRRGVVVVEREDGRVEELKVEG